MKLVVVVGTTLALAVLLLLQMLNDGRSPGAILLVTALIYVLWRTLRLVLRRFRIARRAQIGRS